MTVLVTHAPLYRDWYDSTSTSYVATDFPCWWNYTAANWDGTVSVYLEVDASVTSGGTWYAQLYRAGQNTAITGSDISGTETSTTRKRSGEFKANLTDGWDYEVRVKTTSGKTATLRHARVVIIQSGTITKTETYVPMVSATDGQGSNASMQTDDATAYVLWDASAFDGATVYFEATAKKIYLFNTYGWVELYDVTAASSTVVTSAFALNPAASQRLRTASVTMTDAHQYMVRHRTSGQTIYTANAQLVVVQSGFTKTQKHIEVSPYDQSTSTSDVDYPVYSLWDTTNEWSSDETRTVYHESTIINSNASYTTTVGLNDGTSDVASSDVTTTSTTRSRQRSAAITLTDGSSYHAQLRTSNASGTATRFGSRIIINVVVDSTVSKSDSDTGSGSEGTPSIAATISSTDAGSGAEGAPPKIAVSSTDAAAGVEGTPSLTVAASSMDTGAGAEGTPSVAVALTATDAGSGTEGASSVAATLSSTDSGSGTDPAAPTIATTATDTATGTEGAPTIAATQSSSDTGSGADATGTLGLTGSETGSGTDTAPAIAASVSSTDTGSGAETESVNTGANPSSSDSGSGTEGAPTIGVSPTAGETGTATEGTPAVAIATTDTGSGSEGASSLAATTSGSDTAAGAEGAPSIAIAASSSDAASGTEGTPALAVTVGSSDSATGTETESVFSGANPSSSDTATGTEGTPSIVATLTTTDTATGADTGTLIRVTSSDTGAGVEGTPSIVVAVSSADTGTGTEGTPALTAAVPGSDTGSGTDAGSSIRLAASDTATSSDTAAVAAVLTASDSAIAAEFATITAALANTDSGHGAETQSVLMYGENDPYPNHLATSRRGRLRAAGNGQLVTRPRSRLR